MDNGMDGEVDRRSRERLGGCSQRGWCGWMIIDHKASAGLFLFLSTALSGCEGVSQQVLVLDSGSSRYNLVSD